MNALLISSLFVSFLLGMSLSTLYLTRRIFDWLGKIKKTKRVPFIKNIAQVVVLLGWPLMLVVFFAVITIISNNTIGSIVSLRMKIILMATWLGPTIIFCAVHFLMPFRGFKQLMSDKREVYGGLDILERKMTPTCSIISFTAALLAFLTLLLFFALVLVFSIVVIFPFKADVSVLTIGITWLVSGVLGFIVGGFSRCPVCNKCVFSQTDPSEKLHPKRSRFGKLIDGWQAIVVDILLHRRFHCMKCGAGVTLAMTRHDAGQSGLGSAQ